MSTIATDVDTLNTDYTVRTKVSHFSTWKLIMLDTQFIKGQNYGKQNPRGGKTWTRQGVTKLD